MHTSLLAPAQSGEARSERRRRGAGRARRGRAVTARQARRRGPGALGRYVDASGHAREIVAIAGAAETVLVVDRDAITCGERRLVAHLAADEPASNAQLVCDQYLCDGSRGRCRLITRADLEEEAERGQPPNRQAHEDVVLVDEHTRRNRHQAVPGARSIPDLRWVQIDGARAVTISLRDVIARFQSYEPARSLTCAALACRSAEPAVSLSTLRSELRRLDGSRIVLNRRLRETVLAVIRTQGLSASEIAIRCGRIKHDTRGNVAGETSWLARRIGLAPEGGESAPTPWVHSDVLGLIARQGLGVSPLEVELG